MKRFEIDDPSVKMKQEAHRSLLWRNRFSMTLNGLLIFIAVLLISTLMYFVITQWSKLNELYDDIFIILDYLPTITQILDRITCVQDRLNGKKLSNKCSVLASIETMRELCSGTGDERYTCVSEDSPLGYCCAPFGARARGSLCLRANGGTSRGLPQCFTQPDSSI